MYTTAVLEYSECRFDWEPDEVSISAPTELELWENIFLGIGPDVFLLNEENGRIVEVLVPPICQMGPPGDERCSELATVVGVVSRECDPDPGLHSSCWAHLTRIEEVDPSASATYLTLQRMSELLRFPVRWGSLEGHRAHRALLAAARLVADEMVAVYKEVEGVVVSTTLSTRLGHDKLAIVGFLAGLGQCDAQRWAALAPGLRDLLEGSDDVLRTVQGYVDDRMFGPQSSRWLGLLRS